MLHEADATVAVKCAERFRDAIASFHWPLRPVTASFGVATRTSSIESPAALVDAADRALYIAKRGGRSGVVHFDMLGAGGSSTFMIQEPMPSRSAAPS